MNYEDFDLDEDAREQIADYEERLDRLDRERQQLLDAISATIDRAQ